MRSKSLLHPGFSLLSDISRYDVFYFEILLLQYYGCRLLTTHRALRELRTVLEGEKNHTWIGTKYHGTSIIPIWGRDSIKNAQCLLTTFISAHDHKLLSACPDHIFSLVTCAATWLIVSNFSMHQLNCPPLGSACDKLITTTTELLGSLAAGPDHALAKYAHVVAVLMEAWNRHTAAPASGQQMDKLEKTAVPEELKHQHEFDFSAFEPQLTEWGGTEIFMDPSFWASFMDNLSSPGFMNPPS